MALVETYHAPPLADTLNGAFVADCGIAEPMAGVC